MITAINNNQNFTGKFKKFGTWSKISQDHLNDFMKTGINGQTNKQLIKKKSYDIYAITNDKNYNIELWSKFNTPVAGKIYKLSTIHPTHNIKEYDLNTFRKAIAKFEDIKAQHNGYNNILEKVAINVRKLFKKS